MRFLAWCFGAASIYCFIGMGYYWDAWTWQSLTLLGLIACVLGGIERALDRAADL